MMEICAREEQIDHSPRSSPAYTTTYPETFYGETKAQQKKQNKNTNFQTQPIAAHPPYVSPVVMKLFNTNLHFHNAIRGGKKLLTVRHCRRFPHDDGVVMVNSEQKLPYVRVILPLCIDALSDLRHPVDCPRLVLIYSPFQLACHLLNAPEIVTQFAGVFDKHIKNIPKDCSILERVAHPSQTHDIKGMDLFVHDRFGGVRLRDFIAIQLAPCDISPATMQPTHHHLHAPKLSIININLGHFLHHLIVGLLCYLHSITLFLLAGFTRMTMRS